MNGIFIGIARAARRIGIAAGIYIFNDDSNNTFVTDTGDRMVVNI